MTAPPHGETTPHGLPPLPGCNMEQLAAVARAIVRECGHVQPGENVYIEGAWVSAGVAAVTAGEVALSGVTLDWIDAAYAPYGYGMMSANPLITAPTPLPQ